MLVTVLQKSLALFALSLCHEFSHLRVRATGQVKKNKAAVQSGRFIDPTQELRQENNMSPVDLDSGGSLSENYMSSSENYMSESSSSTSGASDTEQSSAGNSPTGQIGEDANLVTCFCLKPYANRPMIECSECMQWIHFSCAKIRKSNIPDTFVCQPCRDAKYTVRKSDRRRTSSKRLTI
ncbi:hypothetical protein BaRGS_00028976 [Batillaria attramentaria]|uniref:Zinc finger PHD-type domain-containing protein n=1 Tax=Batillaria attramentaria TaxID=370345 RepID=A0ABD0JXM6_9CAEN